MNYTSMLGHSSPIFHPKSNIRYICNFQFLNCQNITIKDYFVSWLLYYPNRAAFDPYCFLQCHTLRVSLTQADSTVPHKKKKCNGIFLNPELISSWEAFIIKFQEWSKVCISVFNHREVTK